MFGWEKGEPKQLVLQVAVLCVCNTIHFKIETHNTKEYKLQPLCCVFQKGYSAFCNHQHESSALLLGV